MNARLLRIALVAWPVVGLSACAITPLPTDKEVTVLSVEPSEWSPKTNTIGGPLLGAGALAGSLITQVAKAIVIDEAVAEVHSVNGRQANIHLRRQALLGASADAGRASPIFHDGMQFLDRIEPPQAGGDGMAAL